MKIVGRSVVFAAILLWVLAEMGPFICLIRSIDYVPPPKGQKSLIYIQSRQQRLTRKKYNLLVDVAYQIDVNDDLMGNVNVAKKTPQGWKANFFILDAGPACSAIKKFAPALGKQLATGMKLTRGECPFPQGNYTHILVNPEQELPSVPAFVYDSFRLRFTVFNKTGTYGTFDVFVDTIPKRPK